MPWTDWWRSASSSWHVCRLACGMPLCYPLSKLVGWSLPPPGDGGVQSSCVPELRLDSSGLPLFAQHPSSDTAITGALHNKLQHCTA